jgi:hypothetical protein
VSDAWSLVRIWSAFQVKGRQRWFQPSQNRRIVATRAGPEGRLLARLPLGAVGGWVDRSWRPGPRGFRDATREERRLWAPPGEVVPIELPAHGGGGRVQRLSPTPRSIGPFSTPPLVEERRRRLAPAAVPPAGAEGPGGTGEALRKGRGHVTGTHARPQPNLTGPGRTHNTAPDPHSCRSAAVLCWWWMVAPTGFEPALPP